jgi:methyl-accepting chemotaxis protein
MSNYTEFPNPEHQRRSTDPAIEVIVHKMTRMASDMDKLAESVEKMSENMSRLVLAEERIAQVMGSIERVNKRLDDGNTRFKDLELRVVELEKKDITHDSASQWVSKGLIAIVSALFVFIAHKVGIM